MPVAALSKHHLHLKSCLALLSEDDFTAASETSSLAQLQLGNTMLSGCYD